MPLSPTRRKRFLTVLVTVVVIVALTGTAVWVAAPMIWPKPGPPVELLGINRTVDYSGSFSGYLRGTLTSSCAFCPVRIDAGTTVTVNASWVTSNPLANGLNYTYLNITVRSPYPFLALMWGAGARPVVYTDSYMWTAGGPGGGSGIPLSIDLPLNSASLPASGYVQEWINASASTAPWPSST